jgi:hypothetical protein
MQQNGKRFHQWQKRTFDENWWTSQDKLEDVILLLLHGDFCFNFLVPSNFAKLTTNGNFWKLTKCCINSQIMTKNKVSFLLSF